MNKNILFRRAISVLLILGAAFWVSDSAAQTSTVNAGAPKPENEQSAKLLQAEEMPLVYNKENTGADVKKPPMPAFSDLPSIPYLPDPFKKAVGSRITTREEWRIRRAESKPPSPKGEGFESSTEVDFV